MKTEHQIIDAFELGYWRRLLRVPWTVRRSSQSILKEINPEYSLEGLILKLKIQSSGHLMWRADSLEKTLMLGKIEGRKKGRDWHHQLNGREFEQTLGDSEGAWKAWILQSTGSQRVGHDWATEQRQTCLARSVKRSSSERRKIISIGNLDQHKEGRYLRRKKWR